MQYDDHDALTLARTLYGEARGEPHDGKVAVAWVIRNRAARARFAGELLGHDGAVDKVCTAPWQFSCWNENDPNRDLIANLEADGCPLELEVALAVLGGQVADPTCGADHYHTIARPAWAQVWPPDWAPTITETARFGGHVFYDSRHPK